MKTSKWRALLCAAAALGLGTASSASALALISNGGFESGFASWTIADQAGGDGSFFVQAGTASPLNGFAVPAPPEGTQAAMTDQFGPGSHVLYQDFVVPAGASGTVSFQLYIGNGAPDFFTASTLDFSTPALNQQVRVDILLASADPFSLAAGDVLLNLYQSQPGDPPVSGYSLTSVDISAVLAAHAGQTLRLRFAEVDNVLFLNLGVDAVSIDATVPEPATVLLLGLALATLAAARVRARA